MKKNYFLTLLLTFCFSAISFGQVIITELADPTNNSGARYVELYVVGPNSVDFTGWELIRYTNTNTTISSNTVDLTSLGTLTAGSYAIIAANETTFNSVYTGVTADINAGTGGPADSNGDDKIGIRDNNSTIIDIFGVPGENSNNANDAQNFEDGRAERVASVAAPAASWNAAEWDTDNDQGFGSGAQSAPGDYDPGTWIGASTSPTISASGSVGSLDYFENNGPSAEGSFNVSGANLTVDITVTAPTNFEVSTTSGSGFGSSVMLAQTGGTVNATTIYVRMVSGLGVNTYNGDVTMSSTGATNQTMAVSGTVSPAVPQFSYTAFLNDMNYVISVGGPSAEQDFTVEGLFLTADLVVTAPANFEVSLTSGSGFAGSVNITPSSGTVATTTVYIRLANGLAAGNYNGDITLSSTGVTNQTIAVNGNAYGAPTNSMVITGVYDGPLSGGTPKGVELFVLTEIPAGDLSLYGVSSVSNGGGSTAGNVEFGFPTNGSPIAAGTFIYVSTESTNFNTFFGMMPDYTTGVVAINGDDSIELYESGQIIDVYGDVNNDFSGEAYDYLDGWAYRNSNTGPEGTTFTSGNWSYSGVNALDGESDNGSATTPFPIGTYQNTTASLRDTTIEGFAAYPNPVNNKRFTITTNSISEKTVKIFNVLGRQVYATKFSSNNKLMDVSSLSMGVYILKVQEGSKIATKKLVVR
ncbi:lamin tail domain-containing protein [Flavobacteriaceae bacterium S356]|uniref:Lamin tail domain-containing protein n=1 Tax=Asprobacillus argus TaxID=3076534 RepID=A0ABU3LBR0_9FLAO|nr:lamin tail domain-containing protein [Flavobacteriaceae bacterium S356]